MSLQVHLLPALSDNYIFALRDSKANVTGIVDPAQSQPVIDFLEENGWGLDFILNTHHHPDHVGGNADLVSRYGATVYGCGEDKKRIPHISRELKGGDSFLFGEQKVTVLEVFGHTIGHIAYYFEEAASLFCGDTLFSNGCGRLFEGSPQMMWASLQKLRDLPPETKVYCAHEYTLHNGNFALEQDPENRDLQNYMAKVKLLRAKGEFTIPTSIGQERLSNPFLRADQKSLKSALGMEGQDDLAVFTELRRRRDDY